MKTKMSMVAQLLGLHRESLRGDSIFAFLIFLVVVILLANTFATAWQNVAFQKNLQEKAQINTLRGVGNVLSRSSEALLAAGELSQLRRSLSEAGLKHGFETCSIVLPDGGILASSNPSRITTLTCPENWESQDIQPEETVSGKQIMMTFPLEVPGQGTARLELTANLEGSSLLTTLHPHATQMTIACLALITMLLIHRQARLKLKAISAIHEALWAVEEGEADVNSLELDPSLGQEAVVWNRLLHAKQGSQIKSTLEQVKKSIHERPTTGGELGNVCDALPYGLLLVNRQQQALYANGAAAILLKTNLPDLIGANVTGIIQNPDVLTVLNQPQGASPSRRMVIDDDPEQTQGAGVLRFTIRPLRYENQEVLLLIIEDITQQCVAESARNSFLAEAAHELRTPLTSIRLYVESALGDYDKDIQSVAQSLNIINDESRRLQRIVSEILSVSEIEAGSFKLTHNDVRMDAVLKQLESDYRTQARDRNIDLVFDVSPKLPVLHGDRDKINLALHNLLGNALKYTPQGGSVSVTSDEQDGKLSIAFKDSGIGIGPEDLEKIFNKFYRAQDERVDQITGTGLGLSISREVIRLHGGDIVAESELNQGSCFTLTLPLAQEVKVGEHQNSAMRCG